ncbi:hypothetical protein OAF44_04360 [Akkermansiaceae bacterium]|nr:hypothetical protein [Akkermansiaceae bacterium]
MIVNPLIKAEILVRRPTIHEFFTGVELRPVGVIGETLELWKHKRPHFRELADANFWRELATEEDRSLTGDFFPIKIRF